MLKKHIVLTLAVLLSSFGCQATQDFGVGSALNSSTPAAPIVSGDPYTAAPRSFLSDSMVQSHYSKLGSRYDELWSYEEDFAAELVSDIQNALKLVKGDAVADLGGGTGIWAKKLADVRGETLVFCVDPVEAMITCATQKKGIVAHCQSVLPFLQGLEKGEITKFLAKASIHHFDNREEVIKEIYKKLPKGGRFLIITSLGKSSGPSKSLPLPQKVKDYLKGQSADFNALLIEECKRANFKVSFEEKHYPSFVSKETWFNMLRGRYMSPLSHFTDADIEEGVKELDAKLPAAPLQIYGNYFFIILEKQDD